MPYDPKNGNIKVYYPLGNIPPRDGERSAPPRAPPPSRSHYLGERDAVENSGARRAVSQRLRSAQHAPRRLDVLSTQHTHTHEM
eukprot:scaffold31591_cov85-Phaeocystis_antarctica.AAC.1